MQIIKSNEPKAYKYNININKSYITNYNKSVKDDNKNIDKNTRGTS